MTNNARSSAEPIAQLLRSYAASVYAKDVDAFAALYDADVHVFDMWGAWSHRGIEAWRAMASEWFASLGSERVAVGVDDLQVHVTNNDLAAAHAFLTYTALSAEGKELRSLNNRLTLILKRCGESWRIVHEHTSAPADFETLKIDLRRNRSA